MSRSPSRRAALLGIGAAGLTAFAGPLLADALSSAFAAPRGSGDAPGRLAALEARTGGRLGLAALDTGSGRTLGHRADERFAMCSTFKFLAAALVLARVDRGEERLDRRVRYEASILVPYSPATEKHAGGTGMTVSALCEAAVTLSDNTAANLLLMSFGGPAGLTAFARSLGDGITRLDRYEPELNDVAPGDMRDTTSPAAMVGNLRRTVLEDALSPRSRGQLSDWLVASRTGDRRLRAGMPGWRIGDKTGTSGNGDYSDVAVAWPPGRAPVIVAAYLSQVPGASAAGDAAIAEIGRIVAAAL